jgi:hypothetical protein
MKLDVVEQLGETAVILPELINRGLAANDRLSMRSPRRRSSATSCPRCPQT